MEEHKKNSQKLSMEKENLTVKISKLKNQNQLTT